MVPLIYFGQKQDLLRYEVVDHSVTDFICEISNKGYMTKDMYEHFVNQIDATNLLYDIEIEHNYPVCEPEYRMRTLDEIIEAQNLAYTGDNFYTYREVKSDKPHVEDPIDNSGLVMNTETNESVLNNAVDTPSSSTHLHSKDCYHGHKHDVNCIDMDQVIIGNTGVLIDIKYKEWHNETWTYLNDGDVNVYESKGYSFIFYCHDCGKQVYSFGKEYVLLVVRGVGNGYYYTNFKTPVLSVNYSDYNSQWIADSYKSTISSLMGGLDVLIIDHPDGLKYENGKAKSRGYKAHKRLEGLRAPAKFAEVLYDSGCVSNQCLQSWLDDGNKVVTDLIDVNYTVQTSSGGGPEGGYSSADTEFYCADCGKLLFSRFGLHDSYGTDVDQITSTDGNVYGTLNFCLQEGTYDGYKGSLSSYKGGKIVPGEIGNGYFFYGCACGNGCFSDASYICGLDEDTSCDCNRMVASILPTHQNQTIYIGEKLITTARLTYKDGSQETVLCNTDYDTFRLATNKTIVLDYKYIVDGVEKSVTCNVTVTIIPRTKQCVNGHTYNLNSEGTDPGCIYCKNYVKSLIVASPGTSMTITVGTTLEENGVVLLATYYDNHQEYITNGYIDNLDNTYIGAYKTVTIGYKGAYTSFQVKCVRKRIKCTICGAFYDLYPDGANPGCPHCTAKIPIFTGNVLFYNAGIYTMEMLEEVYDKGVYYFSIDDNISVSVKNRNSSIGNNILYKLYKRKQTMNIFVKKNAVIHNQLFYPHGG